MLSLIEVSSFGFWDKLRPECCMVHGKTARWVSALACCGENLFRYYLSWSIGVGALFPASCFVRLGLDI
jgi:hypothetical protein